MTARRPVELGCGPNKLRADAIGVDLLRLPGVDLVGRVPDVLATLGAGEADVVFSRHFLEHVESVGDVMQHCARLLERGGRFIAIVPHFSNPHYYSDPTHRTAFGLYSMSYFALDSIHRRAVPRYVDSGTDVAFKLCTAELRFEQSMRRPLSYLMARCLEVLCRRSRRFREFYEYRLPWLFPCMEIRFELERI